MYMLGVGQELPPPGVRAHEARAELELARAGLGTLAETRRQIFQEVAHACIEWSALAVVLQRLAAHRALIDVVRTALVARYRGGAGSIGEVARTEAELAAADRHVVEAEAELDAARAALLPLVAGIPLPERPPALPVRDLARPVAADATGALRRRGAVQRATALEREAEERARAATARARLPGLELRATFMHSPAERPGLGAMIAVSLPWLSGEGRALREAADHERSAARAALDDEQLQVRSQVAQAAGRVRALARSLALLLEREIPAATRALEAERAGLVGSDFNLASWIQAAHALREAHVDEARARAALEHAWIDLQAARGESPVDSAEVNHD
jgi:outer membrane protein TolC